MLTRRLLQHGAARDEGTDDVRVWPAGREEEEQRRWSSIATYPITMAARMAKWAAIAAPISLPKRGIVGSSRRSGMIARPLVLDDMKKCSTGVVNQL